MSVLACFLCWPGNPIVALSSIAFISRIWSPAGDELSRIAPRSVSGMIGSLASVAESNSVGPAAAANALTLLSILAALMGARQREGGQGSPATCAREAAAAAFGALASALCGPLRQEPDDLRDAGCNLTALARISDTASAAAASTPRLAAALAATLAGGPLTAPPPGRGGGGDAAAGAVTELRLQCTSLISCMLTVKAIELRTRVANEVAGVPGALAALVRLCDHHSPLTAAAAAQALRLIAHLTPEATSKIRRLPVAAALVSVLCRHDGRGGDEDTARYHAIMLASLLARPGQALPELRFSSTAAELAKLMAEAPGSTAMLARELAECDVSQAAGRDPLVYATAASNLIFCIILAATMCPDHPRTLHQIAAGSPALLPAVAHALQRLLDSPYDLTPWFAAPHLSSPAADVGRSCLALATTASVLHDCVKAERGGGMDAVRAAAPGLVPSLQRAVQRVRPANAEGATNLQAKFLGCLLDALRLCGSAEAGQQAQAPPPSESVLPPQATRAPALELAGTASAVASASASTSQQQPCCGTCGKTAADGARLRLCSGCHVARFCSDACYKAAWKAGHRQECKAAAAAAGAAREGPGAQAK
jgi:hypothetical protein